MNLHNAARSGNLAEIKRVASELFSDGLTVNIKDINDEAPLHLACQNGDIDMIRLLIDLGADIDMRDGTNRTALHLVCKYGYTDCMAELIALGADVMTRDQVGTTPLHLACEYGRAATAAELIRTGADIGARIGTDSTTYRLTFINNSEPSWGLSMHNCAGSTPLHTASLCGRTDCVVELIDAGADLEAQDREKHTPLHLACLCGNTDCVKELIMRGACRTPTNISGNTPADLITNPETLALFTCMAKRAI